MRDVFHLLLLSGLTAAALGLGWGCDENGDGAPADAASGADTTGDTGMDLAADTANDTPNGDTPNGDTVDDTDAGHLDAEPDLVDRGADVGTPATWPLDELGPYGVGYRSWRVDYALPGTDLTREIVFNLWYPTTVTEGQNPSYLGVFRDSKSFVDAPLAPSAYGDDYPVIVHSHGYQSFGGGSAFLLRHLVSHGWVAVAPDHTGNTLADHVDPLATSHYYARSFDITRVLDELEALPDEDPLAGLADTSAVVMSGHSFGVYTVWSIAGMTFDMDLLREACVTDGSIIRSGECTEAELAVFADGLRDERVVATIPMAGSIRRGWSGETGHESVTTPMLSMSGSEDGVGAAEQFDSVDNLDLIWLEFQGGCHETFGVQSCATLAPSESAPLAGAYALAFGRRWILGDESDRVVDLLDGTVSLDERVEFHHRTPD